MSNTESGVEEIKRAAMMAGMGAEIQICTELAVEIHGVLVGGFQDRPAKRMALARAYLAGWLGQNCPGDEDEAVGAMGVMTRLGVYVGRLDAEDGV